MTTSSVFITCDNVVTIWYSHLHSIISELIQSKSALIQSKSVIQRKAQGSRVKKALNSADSDLILSETALTCSVLNSADSEKFKADQLWYFSSFLNQRWKMSNLWSSAVQRWLYLGLQPGYFGVRDSHLKKMASLFLAEISFEKKCNQTMTLDPLKPLAKIRNDPTLSEQTSNLYKHFKP